MKTSLLAAARQAGFRNRRLRQDRPDADSGCHAARRDRHHRYRRRTGTTAGTGIALSATASAMPSRPRALRPPRRSGRAKYRTATDIMLAIATKVVLPKFACGRAGPSSLCSGRAIPTIRNMSQKDSLGKLSPGINGPSGKAGIKDADNMLAGLLVTLKKLGAGQNDGHLRHRRPRLLHNRTSTARPVPLRAIRYGRERPYGRRAEACPSENRDLPPGFLAIDLADALKLPLFDPNTQKPVDYQNGEHAFELWQRLISATTPKIRMSSSPRNGGSDQIWFPDENAPDLAPNNCPHALRRKITSAAFS